MHRQITNQIGNISILMAGFCLILGAIAFKTGLVDNFLAALNNGAAINRHRVELLQKTEDSAENIEHRGQEDQILVEDILSGSDTRHTIAADPQLKSKKTGMASKTRDAKSKNSDLGHFSLAMTEVLRETDTRGFLAEETDTGMKQEDKKEHIDAGELYQAYLESWRELEQLN
jgi:hypothetical protein